MPLVKVLKDWGSSEGYKVGEIVDISNPIALVAEGYADYVDEVPAEPIAPVSAEPEVVEPVIEPVAVEPVVDIQTSEITEEEIQPKLPKQTKVSASAEGSQE